MKKVIGYARVSTSMQSTDRQIMLFKDYCKQNVYELSKVLTDNKSGATDNRESFKELLSLNKQECDIILIADLSRFSRSEDLIKVLSQLNDITHKGIDIIILNTNRLITKGSLNRIEDIITIGVESDAVAKERLRIKERMSTGKLLKCSLAPVFIHNVFGYYKNSKGNLAINEKESLIIKDLFTKYVDGWKMLDILDYTKNTYNVSISKSAFLYMLKNKLYYGLYTVTINDKTIEQHYNELRIISKRLYDKIQETTSKNKSTKTQDRAQREQLFHSILKCPYCGKMITRNSIRNLTCTNNSKLGKNCKCSYIGETTLYTVLLDVLTYELKNNLADRIKSNIPNLKKKLKDINSLIEVKEQQVLSEEDASKEYINKAILRGLTDSLIDKGLETYTNRIKVLRNELNSLIADYKDIESLIKNTKKEVKTDVYTMSSLDLKKLIKTVMKDVYIYDNESHFFIITVSNVSTINCVTIKKNYRKTVHYKLMQLFGELKMSVQDSCIYIGGIKHPLTDLYNNTVNGGIEISKLINRDLGLKTFKPV